MKRFDYYIFGFGLLNIYLTLELVRAVSFSVVITAFTIHNPAVITMLISFVLGTVLALDSLTRLVIEIRTEKNEPNTLHKVGMQTILVLAFFAIFSILNGYFSSIIYT